MSSRGDGGGRGHDRRGRSRQGSYKSDQKGKQKPESTTELTFIPKELMGLVIGKRHESLRKIEQESGATFELSDEKLFVSGSSESQLRARVRVKDIISKHDRRKEKAKRLIFPDTSNLSEDSEFELQQVLCPSPDWLPGDYYQLKLVDESCYSEKEFAQARRQSLDDALKEELLAVLEKIYQEKEEKDLEVDIKCNFGRVCFTDFEETFVNDCNSFTIGEIEDHIRGDGENNSSKRSKECKRWHGLFQGGLHVSGAVKIQSLEAELKSGSNWKEDERHDLCFYTPSCQKVRVKMWIVKCNETAGSEDGACCFSQSPPEHIPNLVRTVHADSSRKGALSESVSEDPSFYFCLGSTTKLTIDVLLPGHRFDCRFIVRTSAKDVSANMTAQTRDELDILEDHLRNMRIESGQLVCVPALKDFELTFNRRSLRRTYQFTSEGVPFHLDVCEEESWEGPTENSKHMTHIDLHLQCDEWDQELREGTWKPKDIVSKFPQFFRFVKDVQKKLKLLDSYAGDQ